MWSTLTRFNCPDTSSTGIKRSKCKFFLSIFLFILFFWGRCPFRVREKVHFYSGCGKVMVFLLTIHPFCEEWDSAFTFMTTHRTISNIVKFAFVVIKPTRNN